MSLVINPGDDPGGLHDVRVSRHACLGVGARHVATGARNHDQLIRGGKVENTLGICRSLFTCCSRRLKEYGV